MSNSNLTEDQKNQLAIIQKLLITRLNFSELNTILNTAPVKFFECPSPLPSKLEDINNRMGLDPIEEDRLAMFIAKSIITKYADPFKWSHFGFVEKNQHGKLTNDFKNKFLNLYEQIILNKDERELHHLLIDMRDKICAHTDLNILDTYISTDSGGGGPKTFDVNPKLYSTIKKLVEKAEEFFKEKFLEELQSLEVNHPELNKSYKSSDNITGCCQTTQSSQPNTVECGYKYSCWPQCKLQKTTNQLNPSES